MQKRTQSALERAIEVNDRFERNLGLVINNWTAPLPQQHQPAKRRNIIPAIILGFIAFVLVVGMSTDTEARRRVRVIEIQTCADERILCNAGMSVVGKPYRFLEPLLPQPNRKWKAAKKKKRAMAVARKKKTKPEKAGTIAAYQEKIYREAKGVSLRGVVAPLVKVARMLSTKCGSRVTSALRRGAMVCGHGRRCSTSNHALGRAIDMQGNPSCMARLMRNFKGGKSNDYSAVNHFHYSWHPGGKEWGQTFAHNGYSTRRTRLARYRG